MHRLAKSLFLALLVVRMSFGQIPHTLSYQGVIADPSGNPKPDGPYTLTFGLYRSNSGGSPLWTETKSIVIKRGFFSTILGEVASFGPSVSFDRPYWLGIQVGSDPELSPR